MSKKKCSHCGYKFKPMEDNQKICELCRVQLRADYEHPGHKYEFDANWLSSLKIKGKLHLFPEKIVFLPKEEYFQDRKIELSLIKINDVRFSTEKEIKALRVFLLGATLGALFKQITKMITIDYTDDFGIIQHLILEGEDMKKALEEINELRKNNSKPLEHEEE